MQITCINCPLGCSMEVIKDKEEIKVTGYACKRGEKYAIKECTAPTRVVTSSVFVKNGIHEVVSVKTSQDIPKEKIYDTLRLLKDVKVEAPIKIGDIIIENILNTGANLIATSNMKKCETPNN